MIPGIWYWAKHLKVLVGFGVIDGGAKLQSQINKKQIIAPLFVKATIICLYLSPYKTQVDFIYFVCYLISHVQKEISYSLQRLHILPIETGFTRGLR